MTGSLNWLSKKTRPNSMPEAGAAQRGHRQIQRRQAADSRWDSPAGLPVGSTLRKQKEDGARFQAGIEPPSSFSSFFPPATRPWNAGVRPGCPPARASIRILSSAVHFHHPGLPVGMIDAPLRASERVLPSELLVGFTMSESLLQPTTAVNPRVASSRTVWGGF